MRREAETPGLAYRTVAQETLIAVLPASHPFAAQPEIALDDIAGEPFISMSTTAPALRRVIDAWFEQAGVAPHVVHEIDNLGMAMSLVASTGGITLLPAYARNFLPAAVTSRPLAGNAPTIDLVIGHNTANASPILARFLARSDELIMRVAAAREGG